MGARMLTSTIVATILSLAVTATIDAAPAAAGPPAGRVAVTTFTSSDVDAGDASGAVGTLTALYVDSRGAAHVAWVTDNDTLIDLCTIPAGTRSCATRSTLTTDAATNDGEITTIKYLPAGNDTAYLAVGIDLMQVAPPFDAGLEGPYSETEVFAPGQSTGLATGNVYSAGGGDGGGDVVLEPDDSGVDVVGLDEVADSIFDIAPANEFEFESLVPGGTDSTPIYLGVTSAESGAGEYPIGVTKLPQGQTAVLADQVNPNSPQPPAVGMYVQPAAGGSFGTVRQLGISGPIATEAAASGSSYLLNVETQQQYQPHNFNDTLAATMELYRFRATSLVPVAAVGLASDLDLNAVSWYDLPPVYEDSHGDFYAAWLTKADFDGCPDTSTDTLSFDSGCLMYRRVSANGVPGPKVVLSTEPDQEDDLGGSGQVGGLGPIAVDSQGAGWVLDLSDITGSGDETLYAQPLVSTAAVTSNVAVHGITVDAPLTCTGSSNISCVLTGELTTSAAAARGAGVARTAHTHLAVLARVSLKLAGGRKKTLALHLRSAAKKLLARRHRLTVQLLITEKVGAVKMPTIILSKRVTFSTRKR